MKQTADSYHIAGEPHGFGWARVFVQEGVRDDGERWGYLAIISDYGLFGYFWSNIGRRPFREFLASLEFSYAMGKMRPEWKRFDLAASLAYVKKRIVRARRERERGIDRKMARRLYAEVVDVAAEGGMSCELWGNELRDALGAYWDRWDAWEWCCQKVPLPDCVALWQHVWPKLIAEFRQEAEVAA